MLLDLIKSSNKIIAKYNNVATHGNSERALALKEYFRSNPEEARKIALDLNRIEKILKNIYETLVQDDFCYATVSEALMTTLIKHIKTTKTIVFPFDQVVKPILFSVKEMSVKDIVFLLRELDANSIAEVLNYESIVPAKDEILADILVFKAATASEDEIVTLIKISDIVDISVALNDRLLNFLIAIDQNQYLDKGSMDALIFRPLIEADILAPREEPHLVYEEEILPSAVAEPSPALTGLPSDELADFNTGSTNP